MRRLASYLGCHENHGAHEELKTNQAGTEGDSEINIHDNMGKRLRGLPSAA